MITKKTHTRKYAPDGIDYIDHCTSEPLYRAAVNKETDLNEDG